MLSATAHCVILRANALIFFFILIILAHPNVKAFISHGGLLSTIETIYHGVPIVGIPVFGDQKANIARGVNYGYAVEVPLTEITEEALTKALDEILNNPKLVKLITSSVKNSF